MEFFERKGLPAIKDEDRREQWYDDWLAFQADHQIYARLISPRQYSRLGGEFDLIRYARFLEVCAYFSPAHGYSLQVTFLGLSAILLGTNASLKDEAVRAIESGGLLAFGVSERAHGSDLLANEFTVVESEPGRFVATGEKYYIGNSNAAWIISVLAQMRDPSATGRTGRAPLALFALRPAESKGFRNVEKIRTLGIRAAHVGGIAVKDHEFPETDLIAVGRRAWDAVLGTVTLGKFFLGFASVGICERAFQEAAQHMRARRLYGKPAIEMPHVRTKMIRAYARLTAMKLYAYRALDYVHAANPADRRYVLFTAVQKARVSTEGVKVMALLSECIGAKGFESETYFEMALRDVQLIPGLEGSAHINLGLAAQFAQRYLADPDPALASPGSLVSGEIASEENTYLFEASVGPVGAIRFPDLLQAYRPLMSVANVRKFVQATKAFQLLLRRGDVKRSRRADTPVIQALGQCVTIIAYAQLIAENAVRLDVGAPIVAAIFRDLTTDLGAAVLELASCRGFGSSHGVTGAGPIPPRLFRRLVTTTTLSAEHADAVAQHVTGTRSASGA